MKTKTVTLNDTKYTSAKFTTGLKSIRKASDLLSNLAQAATMQAVQSGNLNWLNQLFELPTMTLKSGQLSERGKQVKAYILKHSQGITYGQKDKASSPVWGFTKGATRAIKNYLVDEIVVDEAGLSGFGVSLDEYLNRQEAQRLEKALTDKLSAEGAATEGGEGESGNEAPTPANNGATGKQASAKSLATRMDKIKDSVVLGLKDNTSDEDKKAFLESAYNLYLAAVSAVGESHATVNDVETVAAGQLSTLPAASKEKRAH